MHILLIGKKGQLGWELNRTLVTLGDVFAWDFPQIDLSHPETISALFNGQPTFDIIINAAAYTAVDTAEEQRELAFKINSDAVAELANMAFMNNALFIHYSTDYVFDGTLGRTYIEEDTPNPLNVYGESKLAGERAVQQIGGQYLIFRTSWVYSDRQGGFVNKVTQWAHQQEVLKVVSDQTGNPTWCRALAEITAQVLANELIRDNRNLAEKSGLYHLAGRGYASRYEWAKEILSLDGNINNQKVRELIPALTKEFPSPAQRPTFSALNCDRFEKTFGLKLPDWRFAMKLMLGRE